MPIQTISRFVFAGFLLFALAGTSQVNQTSTTAQEKQKEVKQVPIAYTEPTSGAEMFKNYCAACHGAKGKGDGPAAEYLKAWPPDLTMLTQHNDGKFPGERVSLTLRLGTGSHAHGTTDMPVWGPLFRTIDANHTVGEMRVHNLTKFIESLQKN